MSVGCIVTDTSVIVGDTLVREGHTDETVEWKNLNSTGTSSTQTPKSCLAFWRREPVEHLPSWLTVSKSIQRTLFKLKLIVASSFLVVAKQEEQFTLASKGDASMSSVARLTKNAQDASIFMLLSDAESMWGVTPATSDARSAMCLLHVQALGTQSAVVSLLCTNVSINYLSGLFTGSNAQTLDSAVTLPLMSLPWLNGGGCPVGASSVQDCGKTAAWNAALPFAFAFGSWNNAAKTIVNTVLPKDAVRFQPTDPGNCTMDPTEAQHSSASTSSSSTFQQTVVRDRWYVVGGVAAACVVCMIVFCIQWSHVHRKHQQIAKANFARDMRQAMSQSSAPPLQTTNTQFRR